MSNKIKFPVILVFVAIALMSLQYNSGNANISMTEVKPKNKIDSVGVWEIENLVRDSLISRLAGQAGLTAEWTIMDKSGHRTQIVSNAGMDIENKHGHYVHLSDGNEIFGDVVRIDGSFRSHVCSFKINYPDREIMARRSALDKWEDIISFTGVEKVKLRERGF